MQNGELQVVETVPLPMTAADLRAQVNLVQEVMSAVMKDGEHYGKVPGCGDKPTLLQPGAQKLIMTFRLVPDPDMQVISMDRGHREVRCKVKLFTQRGVFLGAGVGTCSTMEAKFRFRKAEQKCPKCGKETIIKGRQEYGGGWLCYQKKGGCGAKFPDGDAAIENQNMGRVEHDNPADYYNTVEKMAYKRALVSATLTVTAASDIFTQDVEDLPEGSVARSETRKPEQAKPTVTKQAQPGASMDHEGCPPSQGPTASDGPGPCMHVQDDTWMEFIQYCDDDTDRAGIKKKVKDKMAIKDLNLVKGDKRKAFILSMQDAAKREAVPFTTWVVG